MSDLKIRNPRKLSGDEADPLNRLHVALTGIQNMLVDLRAQVAVIHKALSEVKVLTITARNKRKTETRTGGLGKYRQWSDAGMIASVKQFYELTKRAPIKRDFDNVDFLPHSVTVLRHFKTLADLREASGLDPGLRGRGGAGRGGGFASKMKGSVDASTSRD